MASTHIIIVNYNAGDWLLRSVSSALRSSADQITVIDNASSDHSVRQSQSALSDERLRWVLNSENRGFAAANNQVLNSLEQEFAVLMNPDCELQADTLPALLVEFETDSELGIASCRIEDESGQVHKTSQRRFPTPWSALVRILQLHRLMPNNPNFADFDVASEQDRDQPLKHVEAVSGAFMVVRKKALDEVGGLDEAYFMHCEDLDWCKRFRLAGWRVGYMGRVHVLHAKGVSSASRPIGVLWNLHRGMARFFKKFYYAETARPVRIMVQIGIWCSFLVRALFSLVRGARS